MKHYLGVSTGEVSTGEITTMSTQCQGDARKMFLNGKEEKGQ